MLLLIVFEGLVKMLFSRIRGHDLTMSKLADMCIDGSFSGAYLFKGPEAVGKFTIAKVISKYITCLSDDPDPSCRCSNCRIFPNSPDYLEINQGKNIIKVDDIAPIEEYVSLSPFRSKKKVVVINNADNMNTSAANRLLKLLEVDRKNVVYFFITSKVDSVLPTVVSRCRQLPFSGLDPEHISSILGKVNISEKDIVFLRNIHKYVHGGILSDYHKYLGISKDIPSYIKSLTGKDESGPLIKIDEIDENENLVYFVELLVIYLNDILKIHYDSSSEISFYHNIEELEAASEIWDSEVCLTLISRLRDCLQTLNKDLNLKIKSNVKSSVSWVYMLLNRKSNNA